MARLRTAIGLMSGTSMDGIDVAVIRTDGERIDWLGPARTYPYAAEDRVLLREALSAAVSLRDRAARPGALALAERMITLRHVQAVEAFLEATGTRRDDIDMVGFHGQTVFHDPDRRLTVQIGDGQQLANQLGIPVIWDLRADDVAAGGQGAPLAPVFHRALMESVALAAPVAFLNIGGVANVTFIAADGGLMSFDTGPGNALMDDWIRIRRGAPFDEDGRLAAKGTPSERHLAELLANPYFAAAPPKSLDRNAFALGALSDLSDADGAATLLHFTARTIALAARLAPEAPRAWVVCGGGRMNLALMQLLRSLLRPAHVYAAEEVGIDGDAVEAQAFAYLAVRSADRKPLTFPLTTGVPAPTSGGKVSVPRAA